MFHFQPRYLELNNGLSVQAISFSRCLGGIIEMSESLLVTILRSSVSFTRTDSFQLHSRLPCMGMITFSYGREGVTGKDSILQ